MTTNEQVQAAALVALAEANIPVDVQELLVFGSPMRGVAPGALRKAILAASRATPADPALDPATDGTRRALSLCLIWLERHGNRPADEEIAQQARALASGEERK